MNKLGMVGFYIFMLGVLLFFLGMALAPALTQTSDEARGDINCSNVTISNQDKSVCYQVDSMPPLFVGVVFGLGGLLLTKVALG